MANIYEFQTRWRLPATVQTVYDILIDTAAYPRWWSHAYLDVRQTAAGDERGLGRAGLLTTRGPLFSKQRWHLRVAETRYPRGFSIEARGDIVGRGVWRFEQVGAEVETLFDWRVGAERPLLGHLPFVYKHLFAANHHWSMACGERGLRAELLRRVGPLVERSQA